MGTDEFSFKVLPPSLDPARAVREPSDLEPEQHRALLSAMNGALSVAYGGPGAGATTLCASAAAYAAQREKDTVVLAPTRARAARLREILTAWSVLRVGEGLGPVALPRVMTPTAYAFACVAARESAKGNPPPALLTGAEQDALIGHIVSEAPEAWESVLPGDALVLPGFRNEVRDVMSRAAERGIGPEGLAELASARHRPEWAVVAQAYRATRDVLRLSSTSAVRAPLTLDAGQLVDEAIGSIAREEVAAPEWLIVDDAQDFTASALRLLTEVAQGSRHVLVASSPDTAVETFRGAMPDFARRLAAAAEREGRVMERHELPSAPGTDAQLREVVAEIQVRIPGAGAARARSQAPVQSPDRDGADTSVAPTDPHSGDNAERGKENAVFGAFVAHSDEEEAWKLATLIRAQSSRGRVPFDDMAVVCRSSGAARDLADRLNRAGISVEVTANTRALRDEPVVRALFLILESAGGALLSADDVVQLLRGPFGDADDLRIRSIRRLLLRLADSGDSSQLLVDAVYREQPILPPKDNSRENGAIRAALAPLERIRRMRDAAATSKTSGSGVQATLWAIWEAAGVARPWRDASLKGSRVEDRDRARVMNARIDAFNGLMTAADRYEERVGGEDISVFVHSIRESVLPEDTLSPRARIRGKVRILTPAGIAGDEYHTVYVAGVNEGQWPNVRIRSTMLGAADLALVCDTPDAPTSRDAMMRMQRDAVIADELRMAVAALGAARRVACVSAVDGPSQSPSALFRLLERRAGSQSWVTPLLADTAPGPFPESRQLVGYLRRALAEAPEAQKPGLVELLARLSSEGISEAEPAHWYFRAPSVELPVVDPATPLGLSPSALETARACSRAFILERAGGQRGVSGAENLGTIVHRLAQENPRAGATELITAYVAEYGQPDATATWAERAHFDRVIEILEKLGAYQSAHPGVLAVEKSFEAQLEDVVLRGSIDRIESDPAQAGKVRVVDYKTSATAVSAREAEQHLQLGAYQHALAHGSDPMEVSGADLVYVGTSAKNAAVRSQAPSSEMADPNWFRTEVANISANVRAERRDLRPGPHCSVCAVKSSCPLFTEGL